MDLTGNKELIAELRSQITYLKNQVEVAQNDLRAAQELHAKERQEWLERVLRKPTPKDPSSQGAGPQFNYPHDPGIKRPPVPKDYSSMLAEKSQAEIALTRHLQQAKS